MLTTGLLLGQEPGLPAPGAAAPDVATWSLKGRFMAGLANVDGVENGLNGGVNYAMPAGPGLLNVELGYEELFGSNFNAPIAANTMGLTGYNSVDSRKHAVSGLVLRLGYQQNFNEDWSWQAGVAGNLFKVQIDATARFGGTGAVATWDQTIVKRQVTLSPYAGIRWELNAASAFECNLIMVTYKEDLIYPVYGTYSVTSAYGTRSVFTPKLEFGYVYKF